MRLQIAVCVLFIQLLASITLLAGQDDGGTLLVANRTGGSLSLFDLRTGVEMARVPIGAAIPHEVAVSPDGRLAVTGAYGPNEAPGRQVVVIDVASGRAMRRIDVGERSRPHSLVFMPDGRRVVVTLEDSDRIAVVDVVEGRVLRTHPTGGREGHMVRLSPDGTRAYVTSRGGEGTLSVITLDDDRPPVVVATGAGAEGLAVTPDGAEAWVVNRDARSISIVDTRALKVVHSIDVPPDARRAEISPAGRVLVPHAGPADAPGQYLSVYDVRSRTLLHRRRVHEREASPGGFGIHVVGERAFVSDRAARSVFVIAIDGLKTLRTLTTAHDDPDGLAYSPLRLDVLSR